MAHVLSIDGAQGEGGGQILRTALSLAVISHRRISLHRIRAGRPKPGLAAQHITAVRAAAALCGAEIRGDDLGSQDLEFLPSARVAAGNYRFDVGLARKGGSAGAVTLVLQTVLLPLAFASGRSRVLIEGGTHMPGSPPYDYLREVWMPRLAQLGIEAQLQLIRSGWFPVGHGAVEAAISGSMALRGGLRPLNVLDRGSLRRIAGCALAANLPAHIPERMAARAAALLAMLGSDLQIEPRCVSAACPGAALFLMAEYENIRCGFSALGAPGKPSEQVAEEAVNALLQHYHSGAALDRYLGDQILLPLCFASAPSVFSVEAVTPHLKTNGRVIEQFGVGVVKVEHEATGTGRVTLIPTGHHQTSQGTHSFVARYRWHGSEEASAFATLGEAYEFLHRKCQRGEIEVLDIADQDSGVLVSPAGFKELSRLDDAEREGWLNTIARAVV